MSQDSVLQSRPPRVVEYRSPWHRRQVIYARVLVLLCAAGLVAALWYVWLSLMWIEHGSNVRGHVFNKHVNEGRGTTYDIRYNYTFDGKEQTDGDSISQSAFDAMEIGSPIEVRVYRSGGWHFAKALEPGRSLWRELTLPVLTTLVVLNFLWMLHFDPSRPARRKELLILGTAAPGIITHRSDTRGWLSRDDLTYEFRMENGALVEAKWRCRQLFGPGPHQGDSVTVFHMPGQAKPNVIYEVCMYRISDDGQRI